ncbi:MAG TPA: hypothetical protein VFA98_12150 [Thermoanaerobaculia bacterium]|nr:hypothetical protein [Thermoanaerobaculia bacterium]
MTDVLDAIGRTSLVPLRRLAPWNGAEIPVDLEWENPTGSVKDRMAPSMTLMVDSGLTYLSTDLYIGR